jgi:hypothetical protein
VSAGELVPCSIPALEEGILERLKATVTGLEVDAYPADPKGYVLRHQRGAVLVCYQGADYGEPATMGATVQARKLSFGVFVLVRQLRGHEGVYVVLEAVRVALAGYRVPGFKPLVPTRERVVGQSDGVWRFVTMFTAETVAVHETEEAAGALLRRLLIVSENNVSEVVSNG